MEPLAEQFLQFLEKDIRDWEDAAAFFDKIRTVAMDGQIYSGKDFAERYRARVRERTELLSRVKSELGGVLNKFETRSDRIVTAAATSERPTHNAAIGSALPCPYGWSASGGLTAIFKPKKTTRPLRTSAPDSKPSATKPKE